MERNCLKLKSVRSGYILNVAGDKNNFYFTHDLLTTSIAANSIKGQKMVEDLGFKKIADAIVYPEQTEAYIYEKRVAKEEVDEFYYLDLKFIFRDGEEGTLKMTMDRNDQKQYMSIGKIRQENTLDMYAKKHETNTLKDERNPEAGYVVVDAVDPKYLEKVVLGIVGYKTIYKPSLYLLGDQEFNEAKIKRNFWGNEKNIVGRERIVLMFDDFDEEVYEKLKPNLMLEVIE